MGFLAEKFMKDPAFLFYYQDFEHGTRFMTLEEKGAYISALIYQADKGFIPEKHMLIICQSRVELMSNIIDKFTQDDDGNFVNERLNYEIEKRKNYAESRRANRKGKKKSEKHMKNISKTYVRHMENENENENEDIIDKNKESFERFWNLYGKKVDRDKCQTKWGKLKDEEIESILKVVSAYVSSTPDKQYRKNPLTWLNGKCWNDEIKEHKEIPKATNHVW
jgi:uncharacterized protein YdaU (DUF1376 family)